MKKQTICQHCGKEFFAEPRTKYCCNKCKQSKAIERQKEKRLEQKNKKQSLNEKIRMAHEQGTSYGKLVAMEYVEAIRRGEKQ